MSDITLPDSSLANALIITSELGELISDSRTISIDLMMLLLFTVNSIDDSILPIG